MDKYLKIIEWLYKNDHALSSSKEWREKFIMMIRETLIEDIPRCGGDAGYTGVGGTHFQNVPCSCNKNTSGGYCLRHCK